jgi:hypothetical protein
VVDDFGVVDDDSFCNEVMDALHLDVVGILDAYIGNRVDAREADVFAGIRIQRATVVRVIAVVIAPRREIVRYHLDRVFPPRV